MTSKAYRVLHVTECFGGGVARAIENIVEEAPSVEHHLILNDNEERPSNPDRFSSIEFLPVGFFPRVRKIRELVARVRPDAVHLHSSWAGVYGRILKLPARTIYQPHCYAFEDSDRSRVHRMFFWFAERILGIRTDAVVAVSAREMRLAGILAPRSEVILVPNRSRLPRLEVAPEEASGKRRVVMIGRLLPQKDPSWFGEVACRVQAESDAFEFVWIGDGDERYRETFQDVNVRVTGWLTDAGVLTELDESWMYLHSARYEGFPLSILDAASRHLPMIIRESPAFAGSGLVLSRSPAEAAAEILRSLGGGDGVPWRNLDVVREGHAPESIPPALARLYRLRAEEVSP